MSLPVSSSGVDLMPLLQLDYDVATDMAGNANPGRQRIGLRASHLDGAVGTGRIMGATLQVSTDDGRTWRPADLARADAGWTAAFDAPNHGYVSLRATAWPTAPATRSPRRSSGLRNVTSGAQASLPRAAPYPPWHTGPAAPSPDARGAGRC